jgi:hypothetical protein
VNCTRDAASTTQLIATRPAGTAKAPNFVVLVQSSFKVIAMAMTPPACG